MIPPWVVDDISRELDPPAHVRQLGEVRSAENTLTITRKLLGNFTEHPGALWFNKAVPDAVIPERYRPSKWGTKCNIFVSDVAQLHRAPLPHRWDLGEGPQWMSANAMVNALRVGLYLGWYRVQPSKLGFLSVVERAAAGLPTVATWFNPAKRLDGTPASGHIVWVVETPPGKTGIYVTGAGRTCVDQCPIAQAFGSHVNEVEFYGHE